MNVKNRASTTFVCLSATFITENFQHKKNFIFFFLLNIYKLKTLLYMQNRVKCMGQRERKNELLFTHSAYVSFSNRWQHYTNTKI